MNPCWLLLNSLQTQNDHRKHFLPPVLLPYPLPAHTAIARQTAKGIRCLGEARDWVQEQQVVNSWDSSHENWGMARKPVGKSPASFTLLTVRKCLWKLATVKLFIHPESTVLKNRRLTKHIVSILEDGLMLQVSWGCGFLGRQLSHGFLSPPIIAFWLCKGIFAICNSGLIRIMQCLYMDYWQHVLFSLVWKGFFLFMLVSSSLALWIVCASLCLNE